MSARRQHPPRAESSRAVRVAQACARLRADGVLATLDALLLVAALLLPSVLVHRSVSHGRYDGGAQIDAEAVAAIVVLSLAVSTALGLYGQMWRHAGMHEARRLLVAGAATWLGSLPMILLDTGLSLEQLSAGVAIWLFTAGALRFHTRLFALHRRSRPARATRVVVLGAGATGAALVREMLTDPDSEMLPVALLDDDPRTQRRSYMRVPVAGSFADLPQVAAECRADHAVLAVPHALPSLVRRAGALAEQAQVPLRRIAPVVDRVDSRVRVADVRDLSIDDLLGREPVQTDLASVRALLRDKRVLVTGAGGSIGSEIARQVASFGPERLLLLDHDETHLFDVSSGLDAACVEELLADVRDEALLLRLFERYRPEVVFHAAAHKHVPLLEKHPCEAIATNVLGTWNLTQAAERAAVPRMVFVSTDKAVDPTSIMGASKRLGEQIVLSSAGTDRRWCCVRFGNVLGSRGSVLPTFMRQIESGGPVTITDPRMTRYFMSIPEAVQLVLQAAAMATGREVYTLEMGEPVSILELAKQVVRLSGRRPGTDVELRVTGSRPGERLHEQLHSADEAATPTEHPSITQVRGAVPEREHVARTVHWLRSVLASADPDLARQAVLGTAGAREIDLRDTVPAPTQRAAW